ncbi:heavy metal translocating P-type ATPase [Thiohalobacter sp. IOR34]|uniref:heavy metal translocating P-type ATPase n=1 Tax=Thiohalobacter sp. IOR34 TaxID=3057176 RepID=UPI0025B1D3EC|nr:heavy metal translocating P-type ATPase [Thiohalobacter sp. IOR34]WJW76374.1 heavy metal translocating P-type ATPase [Thiohalobacter sp. IOR34]
MSCGCGHQDYEGSWWGFPPLRNALIAGGIALPAWLLALAGQIGTPLENALYWLAIPIGAWYWAREGIEALAEEHEVGISLLMIAATVGSGILGLWEEAAALVVLYGAAEGIEEFTFARTRTAIRALLDLAPKEARLLRDGAEVVVPAADLRPGDRFLVRPGEALATDGVIIEGESSLDESPVTGESLPVDKGPGDAVFAASINGQGALVVEVSAGFEDNTLAKIIHLVEEAQEQKGRAQAWMERFGRRYSPAVLGSAALLLVLPWLAGGDPVFWAQRAVVLLVAAAPCALVISLPITMAAGISGAGQRGILIKGGAHLEHLGTIHTIAFDKTGTLTHGRPQVMDLLPLGVTETELLARAAAVELASEHPLARAVVERARAEGVDIPSSSGFSALTSAGARADIEGETWHIGKPTLFRELDIDLTALEPQIQAFEAEGKTVVLVGSGTRVIGLITLQDRLRDNVREVIDGLHRLGLRTVMLTGDNAGTARRIAAEAGIDDIRANLKPDDKVAAVQELLRDGPVLMVGDGVNDAPALAAATCGVAMGAAGTDAAIEAADIALMADDLAKLEEALRLGRQARRVSRQNIVFAVTVLLVLIPAGVGGLISIATAVLVHEASELLAVANGLRATHPPAA